MSKTSNEIFEGHLIDAATELEVIDEDEFGDDAWEAAIERLSDDSEYQDAVEKENDFMDENPDMTGDELRDCGII